MKESPVITKIEAIHYSHTLNEVGIPLKTLGRITTPLTWCMNQEEHPNNRDL